MASTPMTIEFSDLPIEVQNDMVIDMWDWVAFMEYKEYIFHSSDDSMNYFRCPAVRMPFLAKYNGDSKADNLMEAEYEIGRMALDRGEYTVAVNYFTKCLQSNQLRVMALLSRAFACYKMKNFVCAIVDSNKALDIEPRNPKALISLAEAKLALDRHEEALAHLEEAAKIDVGNERLIGKIVCVRAFLNEKMSKPLEKIIKLRTCGSCDVIEVYESELLGILENGEEYVYEANTSGCERSCVCGHCTTDELDERSQPHALRIKPGQPEKPRWIRTDELKQEYQDRFGLSVKRPDCITPTKEYIPKKKLKEEERKRLAESKVGKRLDLLASFRGSETDVLEDRLSDMSIEETETAEAPSTSEGVSKPDELHFRTWNSPNSKQPLSKVYYSKLPLKKVPNDSEKSMEDCDL